MYYKLGKEPRIRTKHNLESWNKIKILLSNGSARYHEIVNCCSGHNFTGGSKRFVDYCISNNWIIPLNTLSQNAMGSITSSGAIPGNNIASNVNINSGLYLVTLYNIEPISVNATDKRVSSTAIKVTKDNCKLGKAVDFAQRKYFYQKIFGDFLNFQPVALINANDLAVVEQKISGYFNNFKIKGRTGRMNEWMVNIEPSSVIEIVENALKVEYPGYIWVYSN